MILRFLPTATGDERAAVRAALDDLDVEAQELEEILILGRALQEEEAVRVAALPGVAAVTPSDPTTVTLREDILRKVAAACLVLGVLFLLGSNLPPGLGPPVDPLVTPSGIRPAWPMLAWHALEDRAPAGTPAGLLVLLGGVALVAWPFLGRRLAERKPGLHAAVGALALAAGAALAVLGWLR